MTELNVSLLADDSTLHTFAVEYYAMLNNGKTVLFHPGQAAQLDGALARPIYTWDNPAPEGADLYGISHLDITQKYHDLHAARCLANPTLPDQPPTVPAGTPYPIDTNLYVLNAPCACLPISASWNVRGSGSSSTPLSPIGTTAGAHLRPLRVCVPAPG